MRQWPFSGPFPFRDANSTIGRMERTTEQPLAIREIERKYEASSDGAFPSLSGLPGVAGEPVVDTFALSALYYDTPDHRLLDTGITLRRREGGDDGGWHLKLPAGTDTRTEVRLPDSDGADGVPAALSDLLVAVAGEQSLGPIALITTDRERRTLRDATGSALVEVVSDLVVAAVPGNLDDQDQNVWREIEVEQVSCESALADEVEERLLAAGMTRSAFPSKLRRAVGPSARPAECDIDPSSDPRAALAAYLRTHTLALLLADVEQRRGTPEAVHDLRVAARRIRSALQVYGHMITDDELVSSAIEDLRWTGRQLGESRDIEVQLERFTTRIDTVDDIPDRDSVRDLAQTYFETLADAAGHLATDTMSSRRYLELFDTIAALTAACASSAGITGRKAARKSADKAIEHLVSNVDSRILAATKTHEPKARAELLHRARKGVKRLRYAVEVMQPSHPKSVNRALSRYKALQQLLGEHQDSVVARSHLIGMLEEPGYPSTTGFGLGLLYAREVSTDVAESTELRTAWKKVRKATHAIMK